MILALKHIGHWDQPVTLYIDTRPREKIGKRTMKHLQADLKNTEKRSLGELSHNLHFMVASGVPQQRDFLATE